MVETTKTISRTYALRIEGLLKEYIDYEYYGTENQIYKNPYEIITKALLCLAARDPALKKDIEIIRDILEVDIKESSLEELVKNGYPVELLIECIRLICKK